ncbi:Imm44 family immunity protein [Filimonas effusa]|uniref:Uncharacterized protein n=1 Tax=Filimonas effusa TaxID=2508721 RepID=A0A4Q1DB11_9BACT|nr:Imm44 family immunity protein [Filimonas effusa]RXK86634.1 hypothetical protein ESB13_07470 [Filimonas effusa]
MVIKFGGEIDWNTKADTILFEYSDDIVSFFKTKDYGYSIKEICFIIVCRPKKLELKQRVRFDTKNNIFYIDIMLDYDLMLSADNATKEMHFFESFRQIIPFLKRRKIKGFLLLQFESDLEELLKTYI